MLDNKNILTCEVDSMTRDKLTKPLVNLIKLNNV
jgi:hypothetical protein